jgi:hypothetical protein
MANKTCGECRFLTNRKTVGVCEKMKYALCPAELPSCANFEQQIITNGDKIRQMTNEELVAFFITRSASYCVPNACLGDCEASKDCADHWLRWLNAPTESEVKNR